ncbi:helix-turn-helix domain-containing protein [Loktanella agnita]|uniref:helix-turn-helix domain-containing protein n=1 Tax=Loktanella agnita TaxID=287097 RepID=UPI003989B251
MSHKATNWLSELDADEIGASEFRVLFHLCDCHNVARGCFPTQSYLIAKTGVSNGTVNNALNALEAKGLIQRHRERDRLSKRLKPTRYILAFEMGEPSPDSGDGHGGDRSANCVGGQWDKPSEQPSVEKRAEPSPDSGEGAVSNLQGEPSPIQRTSRLQPTGETPVKKQKRTGAQVRTAPFYGSKADQAAAMWAGWIREGKYIPPTAITASLAARMLAMKLVTQGELRAAKVID